MALTRVQAPALVKGSFVNSVSRSFSSLPAVGNFIAVEVADLNFTDPQITAAQVTDNQSGNTYALAKSNTDAAGTRAAGLVYCENVVGSSGTFTITWSLVGSFCVMQLVEWSGLLTSGSLDKTASKGIIKKNTASRKKSRLMKLIAKLKKK